jgi:hypothetical protein
VRPFYAIMLLLPVTDTHCLGTPGTSLTGGIGEWSGPWSDGSKEWTPYWMKKLNHRFGDDGEFWMSYNDMCHIFPTLHRTRFFGTDWLVVQQWTSVHVSWVSGYLTTKFVVEVKKAGIVVIVLSQVNPDFNLAYTYP